MITGVIEVSPHRFRPWHECVKGDVRVTIHNLMHRVGKTVEEGLSQSSTGRVNPHPSPDASSAPNIWR